MNDQEKIENLPSNENETIKNESEPIEDDVKSMNIDKSNEESDKNDEKNEEENEEETDSDIERKEKEKYFDEKIELLEQELKLIEEDKHKEFHERKLALERIKEHHIKAATHQKDLNILNIQQLYEYEIDEAETNFQKNQIFIKNEIIKKINLKKNKFLNEKKSLYENSIVKTRSRRRLDNNDNNKRNTKKPKIYDPSDKTTFLNQSINDNNILNNELNDNLLGVQWTLSKDEVSSDLAHITNDLQQRAQNFIKLKGQLIRRDITLDGPGRLLLDGDLFIPGHLIKLVSYMTQQIFFGRILSISDKDIIAILDDNTKTKITFAQIRNGRVLITHDQDLI